MRSSELYLNLCKELEAQLQILHDKPEETVDNCLKALWMKASGRSMSVEVASACEIMDLNDEQILLLNELVRMRISGIPVAYITGRQNFMGIELLSDRRALIPRKETEILGKTALELCRSELSKKAKELLVLDICCGSGNLGAALAANIEAITVFSADLSQEAVELANANFSFLGLDKRIRALQGNMFEVFESEEFLSKVDVIICNPPYISSAKVGKMEFEISNNEPAMAFDGGMIGTKIIQLLLRDAPRFLVKGGSLIFEVGLGQGQFISQLCEKSGKYATIRTINDDDSNIRVIHCIF